MEVNGIQNNFGTEERNSYRFGMTGHMFLGELFFMLPKQMN